MPPPIGRRVAAEIRKRTTLAEDRRTIFASRRRRTTRNDAVRRSEHLPRVRFCERDFFQSYRAFDFSNVWRDLFPEHFSSDDAANESFVSVFERFACLAFDFPNGLHVPRSIFRTLHAFRVRFSERVTPFEVDFLNVPFQCVLRTLDALGY